MVVLAKKNQKKKEKTKSPNARILDVGKNAVHASLHLWKDTITSPVSGWLLANNHPPGLGIGEVNFGVEQLLLPKKRAGCTHLPPGHAPGRADPFCPSFPPQTRWHDGPFRD